MIVFFGMYGRVISDHCVTFLPREVFVCGGIIIKNLNLLKDSLIATAFKNGICTHGRSSHIPSERRVSIILEENCGLLGAAECILRKVK